MSDASVIYLVSTPHKAVPNAFKYRFTIVKKDLMADINNVQYYKLSIREATHAVDGYEYIYLDDARTYDLSTKIAVWNDRLWTVLSSKAAKAIDLLRSK